MSTLGAMQDRIADELARTDLTSQITKAIQSAIRYYERQAFYFNEKISTLSTSDGAEYYSSADFAFIPNMIEIYSARLTRSTTYYTLMEKPFSYIDAIQSNSAYKADPTLFAYFAQKLRFYPVPDAARDVVFAYIEKATSLSASTDTNYWMTDGEELIRARATADLYGDVIKDFDQENRWRNKEALALLGLRGETDSRVMTGTPVPSDF